MVIELPDDFREFLKLLNDHHVDYLLIGGFAVAFHGYPRATQDIDIWIAQTRVNAERVVAAIRDFGFDTPNLRPGLFLEEHKITRMGNPPLRIEVLTTISGVAFDECRQNCVMTEFDGIPVPIINLPDLKVNKRASGRHKDLDDVEHLP